MSTRVKKQEKYHENRQAVKATDRRRERRAPNGCSGSVDGIVCGHCETTGLRSASCSWITAFSVTLLIATLLITGAVRYRLLSTPLERDEGEYAYAGQLLLRGSPPYAQVYNMKYPGTYAAYALIEYALGETIEGIHAGLLVLNIATVIVLFLVGQLLLGTAGGALAASVFNLLSLSPSVLGTSAHATHFVLLPTLVGVLLLLRDSDTSSTTTSYLSGIMFGAACLMKQHAVFFGVFSLVFCWWEQKGGLRFVRRMLKPRPALLLAGIATPLALTALFLAWAGVWDSFWFWTFSYAKEYVSLVGLRNGVVNFWQVFPQVVGPSITVYLLAGVGLISVMFSRDLRLKLFLLLFTGFSALTVCPGLYFRPHYFITLLPAIALLAGLGALMIGRRLCRRDRWPSEAIALLVGILVLGTSVLFQYDVFFRLSPREVSRAMYGLEPFPEAVEIGAWLRAQPGGDLPVLVLGAEPQIYFYSGRRSATGFIYVYSIWENQPHAESMMAQMIREIESASPEYVIVEFVPDKLRVWASKYLNRYYGIAGRVEMISESKTDYLWEADAVAKPAGAGRLLYVLKRKAALPTLEVK